MSQDLTLFFSGVIFHPLFNEHEKGGGKVLGLESLFVQKKCFTSIYFSLFDKIELFDFDVLLEFCVDRKKLILLVDSKLIEFSKYAKNFLIRWIVLEL